MSLTREEVKQLADLARLELSDAELARAEKDLDAVLGYVERLQQVKTGDAEPQTMPEKSAWRADEATPSDDLSRELILSNFPSRKGELLRVPAVFENPKG